MENVSIRTMNKESNYMDQKTVTVCICMNRSFEKEMRYFCQV